MHANGTGMNGLDGTIEESIMVRVNSMVGKEGIYVRLINYGFSQF
jgi:hypothetical protein